MARRSLTLSFAGLLLATSDPVQASVETLFAAASQAQCCMKARGHACCTTGAELCGCPARAPRPEQGTPPTRVPQRELHAADTTVSPASEAAELLVASPGFRRDDPEPPEHRYISIRSLRR